VAYDVCNFWLSLESRKSDPRYSVAAITEAQEIFLDSYGFRSSKSIAFQLARCRYTITRLLTLANESTQSPLRALGRVRQIRRQIEWLTEFAYS
jgi:hypothetical protein